MRASALAAGVPPERWLAINAGDGAKGKRWYAWTRTRLAEDGAPAGRDRWLLIRRSLAPGELAFYRCAAPAAPSLATLARVAGCRWRIEEYLQATKGLCGLDEHQVRCWRSWHRLAIGPGFSSPWPSSPSPTAGSVPARLPTTSALPGRCRPWRSMPPG